MRRTQHHLAPVVLAFAATMFTACVTTVPTEDDVRPPTNTTDKSNDGAEFVGSAACASCHSDVATWHALHGHANILTPIRGIAPSFPDQASRASVPEPPSGFGWDVVYWVVGGYTREARFIDADGFLLTTVETGVGTRWSLGVPANGVEPSFKPYDQDGETPLPYAFQCFQCHTTGPESQDEAALFEENRPGFEGTWMEPGVQCESCHGPGSNHFATVDREDRIEPAVDRSKIFIDFSGEETCNECHRRSTEEANVRLLAEDGFLQSRQQVNELSVSGGHSDLACRICHNPHHSVAYDRDNAIRNGCTVCHGTQNMALHEGNVFVRGDYREELRCESCHMPFAAKSGSSASTDVAGSLGRIGDTRAHVFRISTQPVGFDETVAGDEVVLDSQGRAALTVDFVCVRCHNDATEGLFSLSIERAAEIAIGMHGSIASAP